MLLAGLPNWHNVQRTDAIDNIIDYVNVYVVYNIYDPITLPLAHARGVSMV